MNKIDQITVKNDVRMNPKRIQKMAERAPTADAISICVYKDDFYLILYKNKKPIGKILASWAHQSIESFMDDMYEQMNRES